MTPVEPPLKDDQMHPSPSTVFNAARKEQACKPLEGVFLECLHPSCREDLGQTRHLQANSLDGHPMPLSRSASRVRRRSPCCHLCKSPRLAIKKQSTPSSTIALATASTLVAARDNPISVLLPPPYPAWLLATTRDPFEITAPVLAKSAPVPEQDALSQNAFSPCAQGGWIS